MTAGGPMEQALNYLNVEKLLPVQKTSEEFKETLRNMWFRPNPGKGFPHVFVGK